MADSEEVVVINKEGPPQYEDQLCLPPATLSLSHHFGRGVGHKGYSSAELFLIQTKHQDFSPFLDFRLHVMNEGKIASNAGIGFRSLVLDESLSVGANFYYDYRASSNLHTHQVARGIELLSTYVDFRLNGYLPVGGKRHSDPLAFEGFIGNQIDVRRNTYYAYPSVNAEVGIPLSYFSQEYFELYAAVGPYYLFGEKVSGNQYESSWGVKGRLSAQITRFVEVGFEVNHDRVYGATYQGVVALNIPLYKSKACRSSGGSNIQKAYFSRTLRRVDRNEIIPVRKKSRVRKFTDGSGNPILAYFVNNLVACPGIGTFESPFCSTALAEAAAPGGNILIYVYEGDGTVANYNTGFVMKPGQTLQGSGTPFNFFGVNIPAQTSGNPVLTNAACHGITVASNTTVRGFTVQNASSSGIFGGTVGNVLIDNNTVIGSAVHGIEIADLNGDLTIDSNIVDASTQNGISVDYVISASSAYITNNWVNNSVTDGTLIRLDHPNSYGYVANNTITRSLSITNTAGDIGTEVYQGLMQISGNTMVSNTFWALHLLDGHHIVENNIIQNTNNSSGQAIAYRGTGAVGAPRKVFISDNTIFMETPSGDGINVRTITAGINIYAEITGNQVTSVDPATGILIQNHIAADICAGLTGNTAPTFNLEAAAGPINIQQSSAIYQGQNTATTGFVQSGTVNFESSCSAP